MDVGSATASYAYNSTQVQQTQQTERREPRTEEKTEPKAEAPKPVANAEGQQTGQLINVTA
jgi:hypothetical protein